MHRSTSARLTIGLLFSSLLALAISPAVAADHSQPAPVFNGKDLSGWQVPSPNPFWKVVDGVLVGENDEKNKGHVLYTAKEYRDFILEAQSRWTGEIDSGFFFRRPEIQVQLGVSRSLKTDMTCSFYTGGKEKYPEAGRAKGLEKAFKPGEWNTYRIEAKGDTFTVYVNGIRVSQFTDVRYSKPGPIGLQIHPGLPMRVEFRDLRIREL